MVNERRWPLRFIPVLLLDLLPVRLRYKKEVEVEESVESVQSLSAIYLFIQFQV